MILRILETRLLHLFTLEDEGSTDDPSPILRVRRMTFLV